MSETIQAALIGAIVAGLGWLLNYYFQRKQALEISQRDAEIKMIERQIEEFYGPLWGLIEQSKAIYDVTCLVLPTQSGGKKVDMLNFDQKQAEVYNYFKDTFLLPINAQIAQILRTKIDLVEQQQIPNSFHEFFTYYAHFECLHRLWRDKQISSLGKVQGPSWPVQFNADVRNTLDALRERRIVLTKEQQNRQKKASKKRETERIQQVQRA